MTEYKIQKNDLKPIREYLIEMDLDFHKDFEMNFRATNRFSGVYVLEFFRSEDETAFLLKFNKELYEKNTD
jgi:hypothetical protein